MKKFVLLLSLLVFCLNSWSQENSITLDSTIAYIFSSPTDSTLSSKIVYSYDANGYQTLEVYNIWDSNLNDWVGGYKDEFSYDANGNQTLKATYYWNSNLNDWVGYGNMCEKSYDANANQTLYIYYNWNWSNP